MKNSKQVGTNTLLHRIAFLTLFLSFASLGMASTIEIQNGIVGKAGLLNYDMQSVLNKKGSEIAFTAEWHHYFSKINNVYAGYRTATEEATQRTLYQGSIIGTRLFPLTTAVPMETDYQYSTITYDFIWRLYFDIGMSLGRYLIRVQGDPAVLEASSNVYGFIAGIGSAFKLSQSFAIDFTATFEHNRGYNSPLALTVNTIHIEAGLLYYL